jgi:hypothetical protein
VRKTKLAAAESLTVVAQPGIGSQSFWIKHRHPITVLKSACSYEDHTDKIGEYLVKIKGKGGTDFADFTMAGEAGRETTLMCPVAHMERHEKAIIG